MRLPGQEGGKYIVYPPIRGQADQSSLWRGLQADLIQTVASDHSPIPTSIKMDPRRSFAEIPEGPRPSRRLCPRCIRGRGNRSITANQWVSLISTKPAKLFGLYPRKGTIAVGSDADIVIFDAEHRRTIEASRMHSKAHDPFEGFEARGWPALTLSRGDVVYRDGVSREAGARATDQANRHGAALTERRGPVLN